MKNNNRSNWQKSNFARAAHFFCSLVCLCFARLQRETSRNFLDVTRCLEEMFTFFFTATHFHLGLVAASISHFITAAIKFSCCPSNKKKCLLSFFISRSRSLSPFFSLSFAGLRLSLALYSKFVDMKVNL